MTPPLEADIPGELRKIADRTTGYRAADLRILADAVEVEQAHHRACVDLLRRLIDGEIDRGAAIVEARELIGPTEKRT